MFATGLLGTDRRRFVLLVGELLFMPKNGSERALAGGGVAILLMREGC
jgi:hypothetical protein